MRDEDVYDNYPDEIMIKTDDALGGDCGSRRELQAGEEPERFFDPLRLLRRILTSSIEDLRVFFCFGSGDPQHSHPRGSDESETSIRRLRKRRFQMKSSNHSDPAAMAPLI
jgi:hypothetical protein